MELKAAFWNVENFGKHIPSSTLPPQEFKDRVESVATHIENLDPDLICLCEIWDKVALRSLLMERLPDYDFAVTDGDENIELVAGWKRGKVDQLIFTQRREFKADRDKLRPGSLVSVKIDGEFINFLFLHTDSGTKEGDYANRQKMFSKIWSLKNALDDITLGGNAMLVVMGDLNTMGQKEVLPNVTMEQEIEELGENAETNGMTLLDKTYPFTWYGGPGSSYPLSNLDHAIATKNLDFAEFEKQDGSGSAPIKVVGWNSFEEGTERDKFSEEISDHSTILCRITGLEEDGDCGGDPSKVRIASALPNPFGSDAGKETVTLHNSDPNCVNLEGWSLRDEADHEVRLVGSIGGGSSRTIELGKGQLPLNNDGDTIWLKDALGQQIDMVKYEGLQVKPGKEILFPGDNG